MPQLTLNPINSALFGFSVAGESFTVAQSNGPANPSPAVLGTLPARVGYVVVRWGLRKAMSQKFIVEQILGGLGLSKLASTQLADPDIAYNPDSGLIMYATAQYYADPPPVRPEAVNVSDAI